MDTELSVGELLENYHQSCKDEDFEFVNHGVLNMRMLKKDAQDLRDLHGIDWRVEALHSLQGMTQLNMTDK